MIGERFGRLVVVARAANHVRPNGKLQSRWICDCDCGNQKNVLGTSLRTGHTTSCGCFRSEATKRAKTKHGHGRKGHRTTTYVSWAQLVDRCQNPKCKIYSYYGGRGISLCERWRTFEHFLADMGERPEGTTLDRWPDNDGNYEPGNCRWATKKEQARNRRSNCVVTYQGRQMSLAEAVELAGVPHSQAYQFADEHIRAQRKIAKREQHSAYRKANRAKHLAARAARRQRLREATPPWVDRKAIAAFYRACPRGHQVDHIVPLNGVNVRGLHVPWNLQYLTQAANLQRRDPQACVPVTNRQEARPV